MKILKCAYKAKFIKKVVISVTCVLLAGCSLVQADQAKQQAASTQLLCAMGDMLVYDSQLNDAFKSVLGDFGYEVAAFSNQNKRASTNFVLFRSLEPSPQTNRYINILAIPGTEKMKDVEVDLRFGKVLFGGTNPAEFAEFAKTEKTTSADPLVHRGFNDYTQTAFFTTRPDGTMGVDKVFEIVKAESEQLILTGHSLGGAVSVLLGSRLQCMGAPMDELEVVTFGAPAVGNQVFADKYGSKVNYTRYTMSGDPVHGMLQLLKSGYVQTGKEVKCQRNPNSYRFSHNMAEYLDYSIRNYLDVMEQDGMALNDYVDTTAVSKKFSLPEKNIKGRVYLTPAVITLPDELLNDKKYMSRLTELLSDYGFDEAVKGDETDTAAQLKGAQQAGCGRISRVAIDARQIKKKVYQVTVNEEITDAYGNIVSTQTCGTATDNVSPIEAVLFGLGRCVTNRQMFK